MTITAPSVTLPTACPVDWCRDAGHHAWNPHDMGLTADRFHKHITLNTPNGHGRDLVVAAEVYENEEGSSPSVELYDADAMSSREQVEQVIAAMRAAADLAFGPVMDTYAPERAELDAAVAEVAMRADRPTDVNRLVAAAIRLREAHAVLAEVTR